MQANENKEFLLYWSEGYAQSSKLTKGMTGFNDAFGYSEEHRKAIAALEVKECLDLTDLSGEHFIFRVK